MSRVETNRLEVFNVHCSNPHTRLTECFKGSTKRGPGQSAQNSRSLVELHRQLPVLAAVVVVDQQDDQHHQQHQAAGRPADDDQHQVVFALLLALPRLPWRQVQEHSVQFSVGFSLLLCVSVRHRTYDTRTHTLQSFFMVCIFSQGGSKNPNITID